MEISGDICDVLTDFVYRISALYFKNKDSLEWFSDKWSNVIKEWLKNSDSRTLFVINDHSMNEILVVASIDDDKVLKNDVLMVIKNQAILDDEVPIESQLNVIMLPHELQYDALKSLVDVGVYEMFEKFLITRDQSAKGISEISTRTKKKIKDLSISLHNIDREIQVPDIEGSIHPLIKNAVLKGASVENFSEFLTEEQMNDSVFLNEIQKTSNSWVKTVHSITRMSNNISDGTALEEEQFWKNFNNALCELEKRLNSTEVQITLTILSSAKRFYITNSFTSDIGLLEKISETQGYTTFLSGLSLQSISVSTSVKDLSSVIDSFANEFKKLRTSQYPLDRTVQLLEKVSEEISHKIKEILPNLLLLNYSEFVMVKNEVLSLVEKWDSKLKDITLSIRELMRKRAEKFVFLKLNPSTEELRDSLLELSRFRKNHEDLVDALKSVTSKSVDEELARFYDSMTAVNPLNVTNDEWAQVEARYFNHVTTLENTLMKTLRKQLENSKNSKEMFIIFEKYGPLMKRPRIVAAIREFQHQLFNNVKQDLQEVKHDISKFSTLRNVDDLYDIQSVTSEIIWRKKLTSKMNMLTKKLHVILGKNWAESSSGVEISQECSSIMKILDSNKVFTHWISKIKLTSFASDQLIFKLLSTGTSYEIDINFDSNNGSLFKEVRNLIWQGFNMPSDIVKMARITRSVYPHATIMAEKLNNFFLILEGLTKRQYTVPLITSDVREIWDVLERMICDSWDSIPMYNESFEVNPLGNTDIAFFEEAVSAIFSKYEFLGVIEEELIKCFDILNQLDFNEFSKIQTKNFQAITDRLLVKGYNNVDIFVKCLNEKIRSVIITKLQKLLVDSNLETLNQSLEYYNNSFKMYPSASALKSHWINQLNTILFYFKNQSKILAKPFDKEIVNDESVRFSDVDRYLTIEIKAYLKKVSKHLESDLWHLQNWRENEYLWNLSEESFFTMINNDMNICYRFACGLLNQKRKFDSIQPIVKLETSLLIDQEKAQLFAVAKYDQWQKIILNHLLSIYMKNALELHHTLGLERKITEDIHVHLSSLPRITKLIIHLDETSSNLDHYYEKYELMKNSQRLLIQSRMKIPSEFIYCDQLKADLDSLKEITIKKQNAIEENRSIIAGKLESEIFRISDVSDSLIQSWHQKKPSDSNIDPAEALGLIISFEESIQDTKTQINDLKRIGKLLLVPVVVKDILTPTLEEVQSFKVMWTSVNEFWQKMQTVVSIKWKDVIPSKVEEELRILLVDSNNLPSLVLQYSIFQNLLQSVHSILSSMQFLVSLKDSALKPTHWDLLFSRLGERTFDKQALVSQTFSLMDVLSLNLSLNESFLYEVINQAKDEQLLDNSLHQIKERWKTIKLETFEHFSGNILIKNWDFLFNLSSDDTDTLLSMKNSLYYQAFEQEAFEWESRLSEFSEILLLGLDIQKQWCYLYGVLSDDSGLKGLLPAESSKFSGLTIEFNIIFSTIIDAKSPIDVVHNVEFLPALKRLSDALSKVRKSLNDFLECQRKMFPRFYFIGNEDLLQLIGSSNDSSLLSNQLRKMFGSIGKVTVESKAITEIVSIQGEKLSLKNEVSIDSSIKLHEWMNTLENEIRMTLSNLLEECLEVFSFSSIHTLIGKYPFQIIWLTTQIIWTRLVEASILNSLDEIIDDLSSAAMFLSEQKSHASETYIVTTIESLISELICMKSNTVKVKSKNNSISIWNLNQRFYYRNDKDFPEKVVISHIGLEIIYGFEYIGVPENLIQTPLLQTCFATMLHALNNNLGGSPFGPAGTGKTESIKYLGQRLGRFVLVFNCDDTFDYQSMGRILFGISQIGAWGCFDEFNRLEKKLLSSVSSQIEMIQSSLMKKNYQVTILERTGKVHQNTGLFITMNLGYAGRSTLPGNLKRLFREFSMAAPESLIISDVILNSMGFPNSSALAGKLVKMFNDLQEKTSNQTHYDFGLRALKSVLRNCSSKLRRTKETPIEEHLIESVYHIIVPKLVEEDEEVFDNLITTYFADNSYNFGNKEYRDIISGFCLEHKYLHNDTFEKKCVQFYEVQRSQQGIILVGESGCGKTTIFNTALAMIEKIAERSNIVYTIDSKALRKEDLYGTLDSVTFEWKDGLFTSILRQINSDFMNKFKNADIWIVFDSDLDPVYAETLNSVLDDNKVFTIPNGERLEIPKNLRIVFEVENLKFATPATVSRCGMIWISKYTISHFELFKSEIERTLVQLSARDHSLSERISSLSSQINKIFTETTFEKILSLSMSYLHIMDFDICRVSETFSALLCSVLNTNAKSVRKLPPPQWQTYMLFNLASVCIWAFAGDCSIEDKTSFSQVVEGILSPFGIPKLNCNLLDYDISANNAAITLISSKIMERDLEAHQILEPDLIIPTVDTHRHEDILFKLLKQSRPLILCGPPGSGKTMTLFNALKRSDDHHIISMNFSKDTSVESFLKTIEQHTSYKSSPEGMIMQPLSFGKQLVVFCDEINLPQSDQYESQPIILFLRQLLEKNGFWSVHEQKWVTLSRIQLVAACNPSSDVGRTRMTSRFTRHTSVVMVDYPAKDSLIQIYRTIFKAVFKLAPGLRGYIESITEASVEVYYKCKEIFTVEKQLHYIFSPRELTRWTRGIYKILENSTERDLSLIIKAWIYESVCIFSDRLVTTEEKESFMNFMLRIASAHFPNQNILQHANSSILFSDWLTLKYEDVDKKRLNGFIKERMKTFCEEELNNEVIIYDDMVHTMMKIDRVLKQVQGHMILVGPSGTGKSTMTRFVAWMNGVQVKFPSIHRNFTLNEFDCFLRALLLECGVENKKICLILDESNMLEASFIERMNTLLANSDIPGLFQAEEYDSLISKIKGKVRILGLLLDTNESMYEWFTKQISKNLHVIFTINDPKHSTSTRLITSPALFNRCVLCWVGQWSEATVSYVANFIIQKMPLDEDDYRIPDGLKGSIANYREAIASIFCKVFKNYYENMKVTNYSAALFMDSLKVFKSSYNYNAKEFDENQRFTKVGLDKLRETVIKVKQLNIEMEEKRQLLRSKEMEARRTLDQMLLDQNESERKQEASIEIRKILVLQEKEISKRKDLVMIDLATVEPAILEAQRGVKNIKKQQLTELRTMSNPPEAVKTTLEVVCILLGFNVPSWRDIQQTIRKDDFIARIVNFKTELMLSDQMKKHIQNEYLSRPNFKYENVLRASQACGPLYQWVLAQINYSDILWKVSPLQKDLEVFEQEILKTRAKSMAADEMISELQDQIETSKEAYSKIIRDVEVLKTEMSIVERRVSKSIKLLESLNTEKERWLADTKQFVRSKKNLVGHTMLSSLYSVYCCSHDQKVRTFLIKEWKSLLQNFGISFAPSFNNCLYNVNLMQKSSWLELGLPDDDFNVETFHGIVQSSNTKYPLIVDPEGNLLHVLYQYYKERIIMTSFLDENFSKQLENSLRFGGMLFVQDGEFYDALVTKVLKKEFLNAGGRLSIELGDSGHEVDVSKDFRIIIYTRDKNWIIPEFIKSKCQVFNFTITKGNLESQTSQLILSHELPALQNERRNLLEAYSDFKLKLRSLENKLLSLLNETEGNILDNEALIQTLERLKSDSEEIKDEISKVDAIMATQEIKIAEFNPLCNLAVEIFELVEWMKTRIHWFYDVNVQEFLKYFENIFDKFMLFGSHKSSRLDQLSLSLYRAIYYTLGNMFLEDDRILFGMRLFELYITSEESMTTIEYWNKIRENLAYIQKIEDLPDVLNDLKKGVDSGDAKDGLIQLINSFMSNTPPWDIEGHITQGISSKIIIVGSARGVDGSFTIQNMAKNHMREIQAIAMGSAESCKVAEEAIMNCIEKGKWVMLQNIQMTFEWCHEVLPRFMSQIDSNSHPDFKLFLTCNLYDEIHPGSQLLQNCTKLIYEGESGIIHKVKKLWNIVSKHADNRNAIYLKHLICWIHALILERVRTTDMGIEYHDLDFQLAIETVDDCINTHEMVDWNRLRFIISEIIYCNRIDHGSLYEWVLSLTDSVLQDNSFKKDFHILEGLGSPEIKNDSTKITKWLDSLDWTIEQRDLWLDVSKSSLKKLSYSKAEKCLADLSSINDIIG